MADSTNLKFRHISGSLASVTGAVAGEIYFSANDHTIGVYNGTAMEKYYGGKVSDVAFSNKQLTISYLDGSENVVLDFSDTASASGVNAIMKAHADRLSALEGLHAKDGDNFKTVAQEIAAAAGNYDAAGAAAQALTDAKAYADGLATNYDASGAAATAEQNAKDYADGLATNYDASGAAAQALTDAKAYADGLATNYDASGAAAAVQGNTTETVASVDAKVAALKEGANVDVLDGTIADSTADNENELVTAAQVKAYASGVTGAMHFRGVATKDDLSDISSPANGDVALYGTKEYVYNGTAWVLFGDEGAYDVAGAAAAAQAAAEATAAADATTKANAAQAAAEATAAADATTKANAAQAAAEATAAADATTKANAALADAKTYADGLATNYDAAGAAATAEQNAKNYADGLATNYDAAGAADAVLGKDTDDKDANTVYGAKAYADAAVAAGMVWAEF